MSIGDALLFAALGGIALVVAYVLGRQHEERQHRCPDVHAIAEAYERGVQDERARRDEEIRRLDRWVER